MLTISQLASYAGVTVRAVRHYHAKGLLPEPERDHSGYRRYDAAAVVELVRIRTLAEAGVPLSRVKDLLAADDDEFAAAVTEVDRRLRAEIRERQRLRERIGRLAAGDSLALPPEAVSHLERMRELGLSEWLIEIERDGWILVAAHSPAQMAEWVALKREHIEDTDLVDLYRSIGAAVAWQPDDPRLPGLADQWATCLTQASAREDFEAGDELPASFAELLDSLFIDAVPWARRMKQLLEERGWPR